jgi:serine phosphatase RsbU (regulator of sigma subunit)
MEIWGGNQAFDSAVSVPGMDAWVYSKPYQGDRFGGDIHYISTCGHGHIARFAVADVAGHGSGVGGLSGRLRSLMRRYINTLDQTKFVRALNRDFEALSEGGTFATALLTSYYAPTDDLVVCNAGHPPPLWYRSESRSWDFLTHTINDKAEELFNLPLGIIDTTNYYQFGVKLAKGDMVIIYTDALIEAANPTGELIGEQGFLDMVRKMDASRPARFGRSILSAMDQYCDGRPMDDDVTLIVLHHNAADPPRMTIAEYVTVIGKMLGVVRV